MGSIFPMLYVKFFFWGGGVDCPQINAPMRNSCRQIFSSRHIGVDIIECDSVILLLLSQITREGATGSSLSKHLDVLHSFAQTLANIGKSGKSRLT